MKEVMFGNGFSLPELKERIDYLQKELNRILSRSKDNHGKRSYSLVNYSLSWLKTYTYLMESMSLIDKKVFEGLYNQMINF